MATPRISVVAVFHEMQREAARTLQTLAPTYQRGLAAADYEVIALDNGSQTAPLSGAAVRRFGGNFRACRFESATPSPVAALNHGARLASGDLLVLLIDGARMLSPGILSYVARAAAAFADPFVYTISLHLGPKPQNLSLLEGYGRDVEDRLLETVDWRANGYDLFRIAAPSLSMTGGFFSALAESNCFAMRRETYFRLGGFEERFVSPGGGLANHDVFNRALSDPAIEPVCLLGEATFHQFHGGVATNVPLDRHPWPGFAEEYRAIRGIPYETVRRTPHYFGNVPPQCLHLLGRADGG